LNKNILKNAGFVLLFLGIIALSIGVFMASFFYLQTIINPYTGNGIGQSITNETNLEHGIAVITIGFLSSTIGAILLIISRRSKKPAVT